MDVVNASIAVTAGGVGCILAIFGYHRVRRAISSSFYRFVSLFVVFPYNKGRVLWNDESVSKNVEPASSGGGIQSFRIPDRLLMSSRFRVRAVTDKPKGATRRRHKVNESTYRVGKGTSALHSAQLEPSYVRGEPRPKTFIERTSESLSSFSDKMDSLIRPYWTSSTTPPVTPPVVDRYGGGRKAAYSEDSEDEDAVTSAVRHDMRKDRKSCQQSVKVKETAPRYYNHGGIWTYSSNRAALQTAANVARHLEDNEGTHSSMTSSVASIGLDGDCPERVRAIIPDDHLLQFGALLEEPASLEALAHLGIPAACSGPDALYGASASTSTPSSLPQSCAGNQFRAWEPLVKDERPGLLIRAWRMPLRKGLYMYRTRVVIEGVSPMEVRPFHLDDHARELWDDGALSMRRTSHGTSKHAESSIFVSVSKFPRPLAPRRYEYARRVWHRPLDGGCYAISQSCEEGQIWDRMEAKAVGVQEFVSCIAIKAVAGGTEVSTIYYENSLVRPGLAKLAVPKGLLPFWVKYVEALRVFAVARKELNGGVAPHSDNHQALIGEESDDDALFQALVELKVKRQSGGLKRLRAQARWAKRIAIAAAIKTVHAVLFAEG